MTFKDFKLPDLGEGVHEGRIIKVMVAPGMTVREDQPLMEVETDKAAVVIPCPFSGVVEKVHIKDGQLVHVGDVMVTFGSGKSSETKSSGQAASAAQASTGSHAPPRSSIATLERPSIPSGRRKPASPAVRKLARSLGIDIETVNGSGPGGRVQRGDLDSPLRRREESPVRLTRAAPHASITLAKGKGSEAPVIAARVSYPAVPESVVVEPASAGEDASDSYGRIRIAPLPMARKTIANVMAQSWSTIPHATDFDDANVTELDKIRRGYLAPDDPTAGGRKLTMLAFVVRAIVRALQRFPEFNASIDLAKEQIIYKRYFNIAVGVHTERGLVPMVLRDADRKSIPQISDELAVLGEKARTATFAVNDTRGGTYTISNAGAMGGSRYSTPIITPPQVAVLAIGKTHWMPWVTENEGQRGIAPRLIMPLSHSIDHRLLDGGQEVQFMQHIIGDLQNPARLLL